jgi:hypothetical protein
METDDVIEEQSIEDITQHIIDQITKERDQFNNVYQTLQRQTEHFQTGKSTPI